MIDEYVHYEPDQKIQPKKNEMIKRNIGLQMCRDKGCHIFSAMDADEIYISSEYESAINEFIDGGYRSSACKMLTYYRDSEHVLDPPEEYYVPLFYTIDKRKLDRIMFPVTVDPSRIMEPELLKIFKRDEIQMHHLSYVRKDIRQKLENMSASVNWRDNIEMLVGHYEKWKPGRDAMVAPGIRIGLKKVKSII